MNLPSNFPLTEQELRTALDSRYWRIDTLGNVDEGLCPWGCVSQMRGVQYKPNHLGDYALSVCKEDDAIEQKALDDLALAFGLESPLWYFEGLWRGGSNLKPLVIESLRMQGIEGQF